MKNLLILPLLFLVSFTFASIDTLAPIVSLEILEEGISLHDKGDFTAAMQAYQRIHSYDTLFATAQYELGLTAYENEQMQKSIDYFKTALVNQKDKNKAQTYTGLGNSFDLNGQIDSAKYYYNLGISEYPYIHSNYFNLAITQINNKEYAEAVHNLKMVLRMRPMHSLSILNMAEISIRQNQISKAILFYIMYLSIESDHATLIKLEEILQKRTSVDKIEPFDSNETFENVDSILKQKKYANQKSLVKNQSNYAKIVALIFQNLEFDYDSEAFYQSYFSKAFNSIRTDEDIAALIYFTMRTSNLRPIQKWHRKNQQKYNEIIETFSNDFNTYRIIQTDSIAGIKDQYQHYYYNNGNVQGITNMLNEELNGPIAYFFPQGGMRSVGNYDMGKRIGEWHFFNEAGKLISIENYKDGKLAGVYQDFYNNGLLSLDGHYKNGDWDGFIREFYPSGMLNAEYTFNEGNLQGQYTEYYESGEIKSIGHYNDNYPQDSIVFFHKNGIKSDFYSFQDTFRIGPTYSWNVYGELTYQGEYKQDKADGKFIYFHSNGQTSNEGDYKNDLLAGEWIQYYHDGSKEEISHYNEEGELDGISQLFSHFGYKEAEILYENGKIVGFKSFDKDGNILYEDANEKGNLTIKLYNPYGRLAKIYTIKDGLKDGSGKSFYWNGKLRDDFNYKEDKLHGPHYHYFENGQLSIASNYHFDKHQGEFNSYFSNGQLEAKSYMKDGNVDQFYSAYYPNGQLRYMYYSIDEKLSGDYTYYHYNGKRSHTDQYKNNILQSSTYFDSLDVVHEKIVYLDKTHEVSLHHFNQKLFKKSQVGPDRNFINSYYYYSNGDLHFSYTYDSIQKQTNLRGYDHLGNINYEGQQIEKLDFGTTKRTWDHGGQVIETEKLDKEQGPSISYYPNGQVRTEVNYFEGLPTGLKSYFATNGELQGQIFYDLFGNQIYMIGLDSTGHLDTTYVDYLDENQHFESYFKNGRKSLEYNTKYGRFNGTQALYYPSGIRQRQYSLKDNLFDGPYLQYFEDGTVELETHYFYNNKHGSSKTFYPEGSIKIIKNYIYGSQSGRFQVFDEQGNALIDQYYYFEQEY